MSILLDPQEELFAQGLAQGWSQTKSAKTAGYSEKRAASTGSSLAKRPRIVARVQEIQERGIVRFTELRIIDKSSVLQGLVGLINIAMAKEKLGDALGGYKLLGQHLRLWDRAAENINWNGDPGSLTEEQLEALSVYFERIAFGGDRVKIEEARKRAMIEAGQIIETTAVVEEKKEEW